MCRRDHPLVIDKGGATVVVVIPQNNLRHPRPTVRPGFDPADDVDRRLRRRDGWFPALSRRHYYVYLYDVACGTPAIEPTEMSANIVGGVDAKEHSWPWMAEIVKNGYHYCGATIINEQWIVSAAHCLDSLGNNRWQFSVGGHESASYGGLGENTRQTFDPVKIILHEGFNSRSMENDIALIKVSGINFNDYVSPACLPDSRPDDGQMAYVTGWGDQETLVRDPDLQQVNVPIVRQQTCRNAYLGYGIDESMICAGYSQGGKDSCQGDSGGPLVAKMRYGFNDERWTLVGVVSWGVGCADAGNYGVYSDVDHLRSWIETTMSRN